MSEKENLFNTLLDSIQSLKSPYTQAITLTHIAEQFFRLNDFNRSDEFFNKALNIEAQMPNDLEQLGVLHHLIGMSANVIKQTDDKEKLEIAITIAKSIYLPYNRIYNLLDLLKNFFTLLGKDRTQELIKETLPEIDKITSKSYRFELLSEVITVLCDMGSFFNDLELIQQAQQYLEKIEVSSFYFIALIAIAKAFLSYGEANRDLKWISNALELLLKLPEMSSLATSLVDVSLALLRMRREEKAEEVIEEAIKNAEKIEHASRRAITHSYIAQALITLNKLDKAKQQLLKAVMLTQDTDDQQLLNMAWQSIIEAFNALSADDRRSLIQEIVEHVENLSNATLSAFAFNYIITAITEGDPVEKSFVENILNNAVATVRSIRNKMVLETAAINLAGLLIERGSKIDVELLIKTLFELAEDIRDPRNSAYLFVDIGRAVHLAGREKEAENLLDKAKITTDSITNAFDRAFILTYVTRGYLELGFQNKFTEKLVEEFVDLVKKIETSNELARIKISIAELLIQGNKKEWAIQFLHQALKNANELPNELEKSTVLSSIANVVLKL